MEVLVVGLLIFLGVHSLRMLAPEWRSKMLLEWGETPWKAAYAALSLLGFVLICWGFGLARQQAVLLWVPPVATRHMAVLLMLASWILLTAAYVPGNSIKARLHHPMLLGVKLWAMAHLLANGNLAHLLLFGSFLVWGVVCFISARRRDRVAATVYPAGRMVPTIVTAAVGLLIWAVFAMRLHRMLIGVPVFG